MLVIGVAEIRIARCARLGYLPRKRVGPLRPGEYAPLHAVQGVIANARASQGSLKTGLPASMGIPGRSSSDARSDACSGSGLMRVPDTAQRRPLKCERAAIAHSRPKVPAHRNSPCRAIAATRLSRGHCCRGIHACHGLAQSYRPCRARKPAGACGVQAAQAAVRTRSLTEKRAGCAAARDAGEPFLMAARAVSARQHLLRRRRRSAEHALLQRQLFERCPARSRNSLSRDSSAAFHAAARFMSIFDTPVVPWRPPAPSLAAPMARESTRPQALVRWRPARPGRLSRRASGKSRR